MKLANLIYEINSALSQCTDTSETYVCLWYTEMVRHVSGVL